MIMVIYTVKPKSIQTPDMIFDILLVGPALYSLFLEMRVAKKSKL